MRKLSRNSTLALVVAASLSIAGCGGGGTHVAERGEVSVPSMAATREQSLAKSKVFQRVEMQGALVADYRAATLEEFARSTFVTKVITGRVKSSQSRVYSAGEDDVVYTQVMIEPDGAPGTLITTRESGGSVPLKELPSTFSGRLSREELARRADELVEYVSTDFPAHSAVGDHVFVLLSGKPSGLSYFSAATLIRDSSGAFIWPATPPNEAWARSITAEQAESMLKLAK